MILSEARDVSCQLWRVLPWPLALQRGFAIQMAEFVILDLRGILENKRDARTDDQELPRVIFKRNKGKFGKQPAKALNSSITPSRSIRTFC